jgi:starch phosphorylase
MGEALERWPVPLLEQVLPRHLQLIYEINRRFLEQVASRWPDDTGKQQRMSLIEETRPKQIRMANLSIVGSHSVNGVSELHSELVKLSLVPDFYEMWPERFNNKTNGVTPRRWLLGANPELAALISRTIGEEWLTNTDLLRALEHHAEDAGFQAEYARVKRANKERLARFITQTTRVRVDPSTLFDVQIKRIHEYKRQLLHVMYIIHEYLSIVEDGRAPVAPRTHIFAGKAAPGYWAAKQIIKLITSVGEVVNNDARVKGLIKVVFVPDYRVSVAERIVPAADLSEQISTAGTEASGTGNMKLAMNGALTMGTLDGANIEILDEVGPENIFIFGLRSPEIQQMRERGSYNPWDTYHECPDLKRVMDTFNSNLFCAKEPGMFGWIYQSLMYHGDFYCHVVDFPLYVKAQERAGLEFMRGTGWLHKSILNVARVGKFSSDRTIREYARDIWGLQSI